MTISTCTGSIASIILSVIIVYAWDHSMMPSQHFTYFFLYAVGDGLAVAAYFFGVNTAPRYLKMHTSFTPLVCAHVSSCRFISGTETSLITLLETPIGPLWVYLFVGEAPSVYTLAGGGLLLLTVMFHELAGAHMRGRDSQAEPKQCSWTPPAFHVFTHS